MPEVRAQRGFDAIVGNPPFQGGTLISGAQGHSYREFLVAWTAEGTRGARCDYVAYFYLRAARVVNSAGGFGLIATNTVAQGDTREVGLDQLVRNGLRIHRAISSEPWPGGANLETATVWARTGEWAGSRSLNRVIVPGITSALVAESRVMGGAKRLSWQDKRSFEGWKPGGQGFILSVAEARAMLAADPRNIDVVKPYLVGEDLNQRFDGSPSRWIIDFETRSEPQARNYPVPFERIERLVRPERMKVNREAHRLRWWQFGETRPALRAALEDLDRCIAITRVSKVVQPMFVSTEIVISERLAVFAYDDLPHFGLLSSGPHWWWAAEHASTLETRLNYTTTDVFETFVQPELTPVVGDLGGRLHAHRGALMLDRHEGLTATYNRVHDPDETADDIVELREIHVGLDHAVRDAYGWTDLDLGHGFYPTKFGTRFTFAPVPRQEVLDRLMELNHERYAEEVRQGLHGKPKAKKHPPVASGLSFDLGNA